MPVELNKSFATLWKVMTWLDKRTHKSLRVNFCGAMAHKERNNACEVFSADVIKHLAVSGSWRHL